MRESLHYQYFGGKLLKNATGYVNRDRLGSIGKFFPYGQERPSATANGKEKFATYFRDSETGLDYAQNRYHSSGDGRFLSPDPYQASAGPGDPGSWNRYAYTRGDPVNRVDPGGLQDFRVDVWEVSPPPYYDPNRWTIDADVCIFPGAKYDYPEQCGGGDGQAQTGGGSTNRPAEVTTSLQTVQANTMKAIDEAVKMLKNKQSCRDLFGVIDPVVALGMIKKGQGFATLDYAFMQATNVTNTSYSIDNAMTNPVFGYTTLPDGSRQNTGTIAAKITINTSSWSNFGSDQDRAITMLHELGHVYEFLFGQANSGVTNDNSSAGTSRANTAAVTAACR